MSELAARARLAKQTMTTMIRLAGRAGLVQRRADQDDRSATRVELTARGRRFQPVATRELANLEARITAGWENPDRGLARLARTADRDLTSQLGHAVRRAGAAALADDQQDARQQDSQPEPKPAPGQRPGRGQARGQRRPAAADDGNEQRPQASRPRALPATPGHAAAAVPKVRAVWRRASSVAASRLITKVPGWVAVHWVAVLRLVKWCT